METIRPDGTDMRVTKLGEARCCQRVVGEIAKMV